MWTKTTFFVIGIFIIVFAGYVGIHRLTFKMPTDPAAAADCGFTAEECGFTAGDFSGGQINYSVNEAWWLNFTRKQEYFSAFSIALSIAFAAFVGTKARQIGAATAAGSLTGGGLLVGIALSLS